jgi:hypothetical protein
VQAVFTHTEVCSQSIWSAYSIISGSDHKTDGHPIKAQGAAECQIFAFKNARLWLGGVIAARDGLRLSRQGGTLRFQSTTEQQHQIRRDLVPVLDEDEISEDQVPDRNLLLLSVSNHGAGHCQHFGKGIHNLVGFSFLVELEVASHEYDGKENNGQIQVGLVSFVGLKGECNDRQETARVEQDHEQVGELEQESLPFRHFGGRSQDVSPVELEPRRGFLGGEARALFDVRNMDATFGIPVGDLGDLQVGLFDGHGGCFGRFRWRGPGLNVDGGGRRGTRWFAFAFSRHGSMG